METDVEGLDQELKQLSIIDSDSHWTEPPDLWTSRVPERLKDRVPIMKTVNGKSAWFIDDEPWSSVGGNVIGRGGVKQQGILAIHPFSEIGAEAWDVSARLSLMDAADVYAAVLYPNGVGFASSSMFAIEDLALRQAVLQTYNDYFVEIQQESQGRLFPQSMLPVWDMDLTVREMQRLTDSGIRGFTVSEKPELLGLPEIYDPYFTPMWDFANQTNAVMNFHVGAGRSVEYFGPRVQASLSPLGHHSRRPNVWSLFGPQRTAAINSSYSFMSNVHVIANFCMSDMFDRFPNLRIVSVESGIGWLPFLLEALEYQLDEEVTDPGERSMQKLRPTEYFRQNFYATFWFESLAPEKLIEDIGAQNLMVATDVPHPTCLHPGAREHFIKVLANVSAETRRRVLQDNAVELYNIELPAKGL